MTDAPNRIWVTASTAIKNWMRVKSFERFPRYEYHRADLSADLVRAALEEASEMCEVATMDHIGDIIRGIGADIRDIADNPEAVAAIVARVTEGRE